MENKNYLILFLIIINLSLFILYSRGNYNYLAGVPEHLLTYNPKKAFKMFLYTWDESFNLGGSRVVARSRILMAPLFVILRKILEPKVSYFLYKFLIVSLSGISMFYFSKLLFCIVIDQKFNGICDQIIPFFSAIIYMFNPLTARWVASNIDLMTPYAMTPLILYFLFKSISQKNILNLFLASIFLSVSFLFNIGSIFVMLVLIFLFMFFSFVLFQEFDFFLIFFGMLGMAFFFTAWHMFPAIYHFLNNVEAWKNVAAMERFYSLRANTINTLQLVNAWEMFASYKGYKIYYFSGFYKKTKILLLLIPIISFFSLLMPQIYKVDKIRRLVVSLCLICVIGVALAQGTHPSSPLGSLYRFLLEHIPLFNAVRNSTKFNHLIIFSFSILASLILLSQKKGFYLVFVFLLALYVFPFFSGKLFNPYLKGIPEGINSASSFINYDNSGNDAVLILPGPWLPTYKWVHPYINNPVFLATINSSIFFRYGGLRPINIYARDFLEKFYKEFFQVPHSLFSFLGIKYVLIDGTTDVSFFLRNTLPTYNLSLINFHLNRNKKFNKSFEDTEIVIYKNNDKIFSKIFIAKVFSFEKNFLLSSLLNKLNSRQEITNFREIKNFRKINPTLWKVKVSAHRPFMLSFAEAYDPLWEARVYKDGKKVKTVRSIPLYSVINGFWIDETGDLEIVLRYKPQDWFERGLVVSILTFLACVGYLLYDWRKKS